MTAHLFAYGGRTLMDGRVNGSDGLVLYTHGRTLSGDTKILWVVRKRYGAKLTLHATRLDGAGSFTQSFSHRGGQFPSIVDLPGAGCWRLSLRTGKVRATFVVQAVELPEESFCEPTRVYRDGVLRMPTTPSANGIAARLFVSTLPGADRAIIYAGGRAPEAGTRSSSGGRRNRPAASFSAARGWTRPAASGRRSPPRRPTTAPSSIRRSWISRRPVAGPCASRSGLARAWPCSMQS
jgi:hypothetical protein